MKLFIIIYFLLKLKLTINCEQICPKCNQVFEEGKFHVTDDIIKRRWQTRWQTPKRGDENYQPSYQDFHSLVGYADIKYTDLSREEADVCIVATHRNRDQVELKYFFNDEGQLENCRRFNNQFQKESVRLRVEASDQAKLILDPVDFLWNLDPFLERSGDYRSGQKGAIVEMFGWPMIETEQECSLLGRAGYLGVKLSPVNEHIMSDGVENGALNPWYYPYQPISYRFNSRAGTQENLVSLIRTCRSHGIRVYVDVILNHFTGNVERRSGKKSSAPIDRQSPFFTADDEVNPSTNQPFSYEYPGAAVGPEDFHCERALDKWDDLNVLNTGWLAGLADLNTTRENIRERQAAFLVEMMSLGVSGFRIDAGKHMSPEDEADIFRRVQLRMGGRLPPDFIAWLEVLTGEQADVLWYGPSWYGTRLADRLLNALGAESELDKIKLFDSGYPVKPWENRAVSSHRIVIQNDDHDSQSPVFYRDFGDRGCILVKGCPPEQHRYFEQRLFADPYEVTDNDNDWPIRILLTSFYHTYGHLGVPDGLSDCNLCKINRDQCVESVPYSKASVDGECAYEGNSYTRVHRDIGIINSMRKWMKLDEINGSDIGLPNCR